MTGVQTCALPICSGRSKHIGKQFMRHFEGVAVGPVGADQQPASKTLHGEVLCIAADRLGRLIQLCLHIAQGEVLKIAIEPEFLFRVFDGAGVHMTGDLGIDPIQGLLGSHERGDADDGFKPEGADLNLRTILEGRGHGGHACFDEVEVRDRPVWVFQLVFQLKRDGSQAEPGYDLRIQGVQKSILKSDNWHENPRIFNVRAKYWSETLYRGIMCDIGSISNIRFNCGLDRLTSIVLKICMCKVAEVLRGLHECKTRRFQRGPQITT